VLAPAPANHQYFHGRFTISAGRAGVNADGAAMARHADSRTCLRGKMMLLSVTMQWSVLSWDHVLILLALVILVPWRGLSRVRMLLASPQLSSGERIALYGSTIAFQWLATAVIVWRSVARGLGPTALGLSPERPALGIVLGAALAAALGTLQIVSLRQTARLPIEKRGQLYHLAAKLMPRELTDGLVFVALVGTVSLCEELIYRGFVFAVFRQMGSGSAVLAIVGSSALFALGHAYQGRRGVANTFVLGLLLAGARSWSDSLLPAILAHLTVDSVAGLVGRQAAGEEGGVREARLPAP
jgi:membrane protease YdiL (CAAX protease family)